MTKAFDPKPYGLGSTVELEGRSFSVQAPGPKVSTVWALETESNTWAILLKETPKRSPRILQDNLGVHGQPLG